MINLTNDNLVLSHVDSNQLQKRTLYQVITVWLNLQSENVILNKDRQTPRQTLRFKKWTIPNEFSKITWIAMIQNDDDVIKYDSYLWCQKCGISKL